MTFFGFQNYCPFFFNFTMIMKKMTTPLASKPLPIEIEIKGNSIEVRAYKFCLQTFSKGFNIILTKTFFSCLPPSLYQIASRPLITLTEVKVSYDWPAVFTSLGKLVRTCQTAHLPTSLPNSPFSRPASRACARASGSNMSLASEAESISIQILSDNQFFTVSKVF